MTEVLREFFYITGYTVAFFKILMSVFLDFVLTKKWTDL